MQPINYYSMQHKLQPNNMHLMLYLIMVFKILTTSVYANEPASAISSADNAELKVIKILAQSKDSNKRESAASILKHKNSVTSARALAQALLHDNNLKVRIAAVTALWGHAQAEKVKDALWQATKDAPEVAVRAAGALSSLGVSKEQLTVAFRKGLLAQKEASQFNAARGLIGIEDPVFLLPYLLNHLQSQASKNNQSGIKAAGDAIAKLSKQAGSVIDYDLLDGIKHDQAGNYVVLALIEGKSPKLELLTPYIMDAHNSQFVLNRIAAARLITKLGNNDNSQFYAAIKNLFADDSLAVIEAMAMSCGQNSKHLVVCEQQLSQLLNSNQQEMRKIAADALAGMSDYIELSTSRSGLSDQLKNSALNDVSDDVRKDAINAYISSNASDVMKAQLLSEVALKDTQSYIISFALSRLNRYKQHLDVEQKQRLASLKSHADDEVRRIAELIF